MRHTLPIDRSLCNAPQPCPYLRVGKNVNYLRLHGDRAQDLNDSLSKQDLDVHKTYWHRPSCLECAACMSARIDVLCLNKQPQNALPRKMGI